MSRILVTGVVCALAVSFPEGLDDVEVKYEMQMQLKHTDTLFTRLLPRGRVWEPSRQVGGRHEKNKIQSESLNPRWT